MRNPKELLKPIFADKVTRALLIAAAFLDLAAWAAATWEYWLKRGDESVFLHYNVYLNVNQVGPSWRILIAPAIGLAIFAANSAFAGAAYVKSRQNAVAFLAITAFYELLILAAAAFLLYINRIA